MTDFKWYPAKVHWFDNKSGEGMIKLENGENVYIHYSAIESDEKWKTLKDGQPCKVQIIEDITFKQILRLRKG